MIQYAAPLMPLAAVRIPMLFTVFWLRVTIR
jgi:hypothetical protein